MARNRLHEAPPSAHKDAANLTPKALSRREFGKRLEKLMLAKGWRQSDLARAAFGTRMNDKTGYEEARRRDSVSAYIDGRVWPDRKSQQDLANALGVTVDELIPNELMGEIDRDTAPPLRIQEAPGQPGKVWLQINRMIDMDAAIQIAQIVKQADAA
jgi:transcriptional regulator with XRE-family HTH domain